MTFDGLLDDFAFWVGPMPVETLQQLWDKAPAELLATSAAMGRPPALFYDFDDAPSAGGTLPNKGTASDGASYALHLGSVGPVGPTGDGSQLGKRGS